MYIKKNNILISAIKPYVFYANEIVRNNGDTNDNEPDGQVTLVMKYLLIKKYQLSVNNTYGYFHTVINHVIEGYIYS